MTFIAKFLLKYSVFSKTHYEIRMKFYTIKICVKLLPQNNAASYEIHNKHFISIPIRGDGQNKQGKKRNWG